MRGRLSLLELEASLCSTKAAEALDEQRTTTNLLQGQLEMEARRSAAQQIMEVPTPHMRSRSPSPSSTGTGFG